MKKLFAISIITLSIIGHAVNAQPFSQANLQLWLRADSIEIVDGKVARWYDLSPNNHLIQQTNPAYRPTQIISELYSQPSIYFNGTNNYFDGENILNIGQSSQTIFIIAKSEKNRGSVLAKSLLGGITKRYAILFENNIYFLFHDNSSRDISTGLILNKFLYLNTIVDKQINKNFFKVNNDFVGEKTIAANHDMTSTYNFLIGAYNNNTGGVPPVTSLYFKGEITEILIFDTVLSPIDFTLVENYLLDKYTEKLNIGEDINIDYGFCDTSLTVSDYFTDVLWSTGDTSKTIQVNKSGYYSVSAKDAFGRTQYDTVLVKFPSPIISSNSTICLGDSVLYSPNLTGIYSYLWSDLSTGSEKYYSEQGDYWLRIEDENFCFDTVFFSVNIDYFEDSISLGTDSLSLCTGNKIQLMNGEHLCSSFLWLPSSTTNPSETVSETGWYKLEVYNENSCYASDSVFVNIVGTAPTVNYFVENLCFGDTTVFYDSSSPLSDILNWKWIINESDTIISQNAEFVFSDVGQQNIQLLLETHSGCDNNLDFNINIKPKAQISFTALPSCTGVENQFTSSVNIPSSTNVSSYSWQINNVEVGTEANLSYLFPTIGDYNLTFELTLDNGCTSNYDSVVNVQDFYPLPEYFSPLFPQNNYLLSSDSQDVDFTWNFPPEAKFFKLQFSDSQDFSNILYETENIFNNTYSYDLSLLPQDSIFWRIQAYNFCEDFSISNAYLIYKFSATDLSNLALWLRADSVEIIDEKVARWYDLSSNEHIIQQTNASNRPTQIISELKSQPSIYFNGTNNYFDGGDILNIGYSSQTMFVIAKSEKATGSIIAKSLLGAITKRYAILFGNNISFFFQDNLERSISTDLIMNKFLYINTIIDKQINKNFFNVNNDFVGENTIAANYDMTSTYNFLIGGYNNNTGGIPPSTSLYFKGEISEILIFDTVLSAENTNLLETYLHNKYSPPLSLGYDIRVPYGFCDTAISAYKPWFTSYLWSTGETDSVIHVNKPGVYSCTVTDIFGFESSDDIRVFYPQVNNFADTIICYGNSVIWDAELTGDYSYEWLGSPETTQSIEIFYEGDYALIITDSLGCKYYSDTINFSFDKYELTASIGPADTSLCAGNRLSLVTNSDETVSYNWNTGETTPEITITESGTYSVTCTNWRACSAEDEIAVTIMGTVPNPDFSVQGHCAKNLISFNDQSTSPEGNINFWQWFVNGEVFASSQNSEITLDEPGNYNIRLQIKTDLDCGDYLDETIEVFPLPEPKFFPDYYCQWAEIDFISKTTILSGNILNNYWQFNDFDLFGDTVSYVFENSGINTVKLISESEQACRDSIIKEIFVKQAVKPDFLSQNACVNSESSFINITEQSSYNLPVSWNWNFGDGNFGENSDPSHVYENSGIYDVSLSVVWQNTCETSITKQIEIYDNPELELLVENSCVNSEFTVAKNIESQSGEIVEYIWNFNGNEIISNTDASPTFVCDTIGEYPISLEIKSEYGCEAFAQDTIKVYPLPQVDFAMSRDWGGFPFTVDFTNLSQGASQYLWSFGDSESSIEENPTHIYISEGEFFVNLTAVSEYGCSDYIEKKIISVNPIMDLILYDLRTKLNGNYLEISVYIINNGTLPVSKPELVLNLGEGKIYRESLDSIPVSQVIDYTLKTEIWRAEKTLPEIICLEVFANPYEGHYENNTEDNLICSANVKNLLVFQPYPNPTNQSLNIEYILAKPAECLITITNSMGKQVYVNKFENQTQYNKLELDVSEFAVGVYYLQVQSGGERESRKVVVY